MRTSSASHLISGLLFQLVSHYLHEQVQRMESNNPRYVIFFVPLVVIWQLVFLEPLWLIVLQELFLAQQDQYQESFGEARIISFQFLSQQPYDHYSTQPFPFQDFGNQLTPRNLNQHVEILHCPLNLSIGDGGHQWLLFLSKVHSTLFRVDLSLRSVRLARFAYAFTKLKNCQIVIINSTTMTDASLSHDSEQGTKNVIFEDEDFQKLAIAQRKLYTAPLKTTGLFVSIYLISKYANLSQILPNPIAKKAEQTKFGQFFRNRSKLVFFHSTLFLGIATFLGAYFAKQINKYKIFSKYRKEVTYYMRWKLEQQIKSQSKNMNGNAIF